MRPLLLSLSITVLLAAPGAALAQDVAPPPSRVSLGLRAVGRFGDYALGGLGGQLGITLSQTVHLAFFSDHMVGTRDGVLRHDHEVGGMLQFHLLRGARWALFPEVGACASLAVTRAPEAAPADTRSASTWGGTSSQADTRRPQATTIEDIQFGVRAGLGAELSVGGSLTVGAEALAITYLGHAISVWEGDVEATPGVVLSAVGQVTLHASYNF